MKLFAMLVLGASFALAAPIVTEGGTVLAGQGLITSVINTTTVNFNGGTAPTGSPVNYSLPAGNNNIVIGNSSGVYASPVNDTTFYLTVGPTGGRTPVTITFSQDVDYFGFYASSLDTYNRIVLRRNGVQVLSLTGTQLAQLGGFPADGNQGRGLYVNIFSSNASEYFNEVVLSSSSNAFETDNHAFRTVGREVVPEPSSFLTLVPAAAALAFFRRKR
jgi:hypothetical protein